MVANVLVRYDPNDTRSDVQWTASELAEKMNKLRPTPDQIADFYVDPIALSHGLSLFQKQLNKLGLQAMIVSTMSKSIPDFFDLTGAQRTIEIVFSNYQNYCPENEQLKDLVGRMVIIRNSLLSKNNYEASSHSSPSAVYGNLFYPVLQKFLKKGTEKKSRIVRKSPSKLRQKAINLSTSKLVKSVELEFGKKNSLFYLESATKVASERKLLFDEGLETDDDEAIEQNEKEEENVTMILENFEIDDAIIQATADLPRKYVVFGDEDRNNVLKLFDVVREVTVSREYREINNMTASVVIELLSTLPYYATISERTVKRWHALRLQNNNKPGRKINQIFESEIWGNLMMCVLEKNVDEVSNINQYCVVY